MVKVLLCGDIKNEWKSAVEKVNKVNGSKHGPFDMVLCVGSVSKPPSDLKPQLPMYLISGDGNNNSFDAQGEQLLENIIYLGKLGIQQLHGLNIAYLSGVYDADKYQNLEHNSITHYTENEVELLSTVLEQQKVDVLLTAEMPMGFENNVDSESIPKELKDVAGSLAVRKLVEKSKPRYHVTASNHVFYQRLPYLNENESITRLISMSNVEPLDKKLEKSKKWIHALSLDVNTSSTAVPPPTGTTANPFQKVNKKRSREGLSQEQIDRLQKQSQQQAKSHFYDTQNTHDDMSRKHRGRKRKNIIPPRSDCWFCLATPSIEKHLITSIGDEAYLALPKGGIVPDHVLIVPISHESSMLDLSDSAANEIEQFKLALRKYFATQNKTVIIFERNIATQGKAHCHVQVVPIPNESVSMILPIFEEQCAAYNVDCKEHDNLESIRQVAYNEQYFYIELPTSTTDIKRMLHLINGRHYSQFGRQVAATILNMNRRTDWQHCVVPLEKETKYAQSFKSSFKPFDFTV